MCFFLVALFESKLSSVLCFHFPSPPLTPPAFLDLCYRLQPNLTLLGSKELTPPPLHF